MTDWLGITYDDMPWIGLTAVPDKHCYWYYYPVDDTACSMGSIPTEATSLIP